MLRAHEDGTWRILVAQVDGVFLQGQPTRTLRERILVGAARTKGHELKGKLLGIEVKLHAEVAVSYPVVATFTVLGLYTLTTNGAAHDLIVVADQGPSVVGPHHGQHECLAAQILEVVFHRAAGKEHGPPVSLLCLHQVGMACTGDWIGTIVVECALRQDRIALVCLVGSPHRLRAVDDLRMPVTRSALGCHQVIIAVDLVDMRAFAPDGLLLGSAALVDEDATLAHHLVGGQVKFLKAHGAMSGIFGLVVGCIVVVHHVSLAIVVNEDRRVDAANRMHIDRVTPRTSGILRLHIEVAGSHIGGDHVVGSRLWIVAQSWCKDTSAHMLANHVHQLRLTAQHVSDLTPVHQVTAVEDGHTREVGEGRGDQIIVTLAIRTDGRIREESGEDWIVEFRFSSKRMLGIVAVIADIGQVVEHRLSSRFRRHRVLRGSATCSEPCQCHDSRTGRHAHSFPLTFHRIHVKFGFLAAQR